MSTPPRRDAWPLVSLSLLAGACQPAKDTASEGVPALGLEQAELRVGNVRDDDGEASRQYVSAPPVGTAFPAGELVVVDPDFNANGVESAGGVWVIPPGSTGTVTPSTAGPAAYAFGTTDYSLFGYPGPAIGDFDGDGADDLAFGTSFYNAPRTGAQLSFVSGTTIPDSGSMTLAAELNVEQPTDVLSISSSLDFDGDGMDELVLELKDYDTGEWSQRICWGPYTASMTLDDCELMPDTTWFAATEHRTPPSGDANGDGYRDMLAGTGDAMVILLGRANRSLSSADAATRWTEFTGHDVRVVLNAHGDVDGDGKDDVVIAEPPDDGLNTAGTDAHGEDLARGRGAVYVFAGDRPGTYTLDDANLRVLGAPEVAGFGRDARLADLDNSGFADLIVSFNGLSGYYGEVGVPHQTFSAFDGAFVFRDPTLDPSTPLTLADASGGVSTTKDGLDFGDYVDVLDHDGDGYLDLLVGGNNRAWVFSGAQMLGL